jgi:predicted PurR-regulated permease PerM
MRNWKVFIYFLMLVGFTLLFSGLYFAVNSVDTTIHNTKEQVEINTNKIDSIGNNLESKIKIDSIRWSEIIKKMDEHMTEQTKIYKKINK